MKLLSKILGMAVPVFESIGANLGKGNTEKNNEITQAYLIGCISTVMALAGGAAPSPTVNE